MADRREGFEPVPGFPIRFVWTKAWEPLFDRQVELIRDDLRRAVVDDRVIVYLSCPVSSRGGGHSVTNVEIAKATEIRLLAMLGERFWILNPARYQMESKEGAGLLEKHARDEWGNDDWEEKLQALPKPEGGDYMRMWTKVLVENRSDSTFREAVGDYFDMYYFLGPSDVGAFFPRNEGVTLTAAIETYFARKFSTDQAFRTAFDSWREEATWEEQRKAFFRYYAVRASTNFSPGSHDEWNIVRLLNERRRAANLADQIAVFFDGKSIPMASTEAAISSGYARE